MAKIPVCVLCGSHQIFIAIHARWDAESQHWNWIMSENVFPRCEACGIEAPANWIPADTEEKS